MQRRRCCLCLTALVIPGAKPEGCLKLRTAKSHASLKRCGTACDVRLENMEQVMLCKAKLYSQSSLKDYLGLFLKVKPDQNNLTNTCAVWNSTLRRVRKTRFGLSYCYCYLVNLLLNPTLERCELWWYLSLTSELLNWVTMNFPLIYRHGQNPTQSWGRTQLIFSQESLLFQPSLCSRGRRARKREKGYPKYLQSSLHQTLHLTLLIQPSPGGEHTENPRWSYQNQSKRQHSLQSYCDLTTSNIVWEILYYCFTSSLNYTNDT